MISVAGKLFVAGILTAAPVMAEGAAKIRVCVAATDETPVAVLLQAKAIASLIFATAEAAVEWQSRKAAACHQAEQSGALTIEFVNETPAAQHPGALAYAQLNQGFRIAVLFDRVEIAAGKSSRVSSVLAHVMAHEIAHLIQGIARHSEIGVMKARWDPNDFCLMTYHPLAFTAEDIELIQLGLARRAATGPRG